MPKPKMLFVLAFFSIFAVIIALPTYARDTSGVPVTTVVTVLGDKHAPAPTIDGADVNAYEGRARLAVTSWTPARGPQAKLQLAILINEAEGPVAVGSELDELSQFIMSQRRSTAVGLFYAAYDDVETASPFSTDHAAVAKGLHITPGFLSANSPSIYESISSLIKKWPTPAAPRREMLVIASGFDPLFPDFEDPYLDSAITDAQKAGIVVHVLYSGGQRLGESFNGEIAQNNLDMISSQTGGANLYTGIIPPISFGVFLQRLNVILSNQYVLTFDIPPAKGRKGELRKVEVKLEEHNAKLAYPQEVLVPGQ
jgi:hypothetical protein